MTVIEKCASSILAEGSSEASLERTTGSADDLLYHVLRDWRLHCHGQLFSNHASLHF